MVQNCINKEQKVVSVKKQRACFNKARIETYKIVIILNSAWEKSFTHTEFNMEVIAARGWGPLTRNLLDHPEIIATAEHLCDEAETASRETSSSLASSLDYNNGLASTVMADILQNIDSKAVCQQIRNNQQEGEQTLANLADHKKLSVSVVFKAALMC